MSRNRITIADILELARLETGGPDFPKWKPRLRALEASGVPLAAGDPEGPSSDQPPPAAGAATATPPAGQPTGQQPPEAAAAPEGQPAAVPEGLAPLMDRITPLLEADQDGNTTLAGLLEFYDLATNEQRLDEFEQWWEQVGRRFEWLDADEGQPGEPGEPGAAPEGDDPRDQRIAELEARLEQIESQGRVSEQEQQVQTQLNELLTRHGIQEDRSLPEEKWPSTRILRLALSYDGDLEKAVAEYLDLTGQAQTALLNGAGETTAPVNGSPGASLSGGSPDMEPAAVRSWGDARQAAMARMRSGG